MSELKLGRIIDGEADRDAIHIAVAPLIAHVRLLPGQDVGVDGDKSSSIDPIGIVDPFLKEIVHPGQRFWVFLYPNTVTGMRHEWRHPAFQSVALVDPELDRSIQFLRDAAVELETDYDSLLSPCHEICNGDYVIERGNDNWRFSWNRLVCEGFWEHYERVTKRQVPESDRGGYSCSC